RVSHLDDRSAAEFRLPGEPIERLWHLRRAAMMADIGDVAIALMMNGWLIGAAPLEIIVADRAHVHRLGRRPDLLLARGCRDDRRKNHRPEESKDHSQASRNKGLAFRPKSVAPHTLSPHWKCRRRPARADRLRMIDRCISCTGRVLHVRYCMAGTGRIANLGPSSGEPCIRSIFSARLALGERLAGQTRNAPAGFLVIRGA